MADFINAKKAEKLLGKLKNPEQPLFEKKIIQGDGGVRGQIEFAKPVLQALELLFENGYGNDYIGDKNPKGLSRLNEFNKLVGEGKQDPALAARTMKEYDAHKLSQFVYMMNKRSVYDKSFITDVIKSGGLVAILERAVELGSNKKPPVDYAALTRAPSV